MCFEYYYNLQSSNTLFNSSLLFSFLGANWTLLKNSMERFIKNSKERYMRISKEQSADVILVVIMTS